MPPITGLTNQEVEQRRQNGQGNNIRLGTSRSYWNIARANLFTFFNNILFVIGVALIAMGQTLDAFTSVGLGLVIAVIGTLQEIRAKRQLEQIALLNRPTVAVVREGREQALDPAELVEGDVVHVRSGDQIVVDGRVIGDGRLEMDESLLTGEADLVIRRDGDALLSGSVCVAGDAHMLAERVGLASYANQLTAAARTYQVVATPLQRKINLIVRVVMLVVAMMSIIILLTALLEKLPLIRLVQLAAVLTGQVPYGLFLTVVIAYSIGASFLSQRGALVQQVNAIESLSHVDVLCMDKTGTLTANRIQFRELKVFGRLSHAEVASQLGTFVASASSTNRTGAAIAAALPQPRRAPVDEVLFASARKWSALAFDTPEMPGVYVLGALEMLQPHLSELTADGVGPLHEQAREWSDAGLRVLLLAHNPHTTTLHDASDQPCLPRLEPLALVALCDELRPQAAETLAAFAELGIQLKLISGDNPQAVAALARQVGLTGPIQLVSGPELAQMDAAEFERVAEQATIFGRIAPEQKEKLVATLTDKGYYVAMMGDGVNDVLSVKKARLGIAMQSGSMATRNVADMVLLDDSFAALRPAFDESTRIVNGMAAALHLYIARVATTVLLIIAITMVGLSFPFEPAQVALTLFTVGIPSLFTTWLAHTPVRDQDLLRSLARFVLPVSLVTMLLGVALYTGLYTSLLNDITTAQIPPRVVRSFEAYTGLTYNVDDAFGNAAATIVAQTALSIFISYTAFLLIVFLEPPHPFFTGWAEISRDRRPTWLAAGLALAFTIVISVPNLAAYFGLFRPGPPLLIGIGVLLPIWFFTVRAIWRSHLFDRILSV